MKLNLKRTSWEVSNMSLGPCIYAGWFGVLIASQFIAGSHMNRSGVVGVVKGFIGIIGAFLCWAFISAYCGAAEMPGCVHSKAFGITVGIGTLGFLLFLLSCLTLEKKSFQVTSGGAA